MRRLAGAAGLAALLLAGCGSSAPDPAKRLPARVTAELAGHWPAIGRPVAISARCAGVQCRLTYDYTAPDGYRREYAATLPTRCGRSCTIQWSALREHVVRTLGIDGSYPVGECDHAMSNALKSGSTLAHLAGDSKVRLACAGVHKGVYTGPLLSSPSG